MPPTSFTEKLQGAPASSFHILDPAKATRMSARTLFIPSPEDVAKAIAAIPKGQTRTIVGLRRDLAATGNAETACPAATIKYWKWLAYASEEVPEGGPRYAVPWWRVLKDGKPSRHMPGGVEKQITLLGEDGDQVRQRVAGTAINGSIEQPLEVSVLLMRHRR